VRTGRLVAVLCLAVVLCCAASALAGGKGKGPKDDPHARNFDRMLSNAMAQMSALLSTWTYWDELDLPSGADRDEVWAVLEELDAALVYAIDAQDWEVLVWVNDTADEWNNTLGYTRGYWFHGPGADLRVDYVPGDLGGGDLGGW